MLYAEGLEAAALRRSKAQALKSEREAREMDGATFHPEITELAKALCGGRSDDPDATPAWQRLTSAKRTAVLERLREMKEMKDQAEVRATHSAPLLSYLLAPLILFRAAHHIHGSHPYLPTRSLPSPRRSRSARSSPRSTRTPAR